MQMVLPANYAVIEEEEMMYLEGGFTKKVEKIVYGAIGAALWTFLKKSVSASIVAVAVKQASLSLTLGINSMLVAATINPGAALVIGVTVVGGVYKLGRKMKLW